MGSSINDEKVAGQITDLLEKSGILCWRYEPDADRQVSESRLDAVGAGRTVVFVYSRNSCASGQFQNEVQRARDGGKSVIIVSITDAPVPASLEPLLSGMDSIDATPPHRARASATIVQSVRASLAVPIPEPALSLPPRPTDEVSPPSVLPLSLSTPLPERAEEQSFSTARLNDYRWTGELTLWLIACGVPSTLAAILFTFACISLAGGYSLIFGRFDATGVIWLTIKAEGALNLIYFGVMFGWIYVTYGNARALGARDLQYPPIWAIAGFIVPLVSLYIPRRIMQEVWKTSDPFLAADDAYGWKSVPQAGLVNTWHASLCFAVFGAILANIARTSAPMTFQAMPTLNVPVLAGIFFLILCILTVTSFVAFLILAGWISSRQEQRYDRIAALHNRLTSRPQLRKAPILFGIVLTITTVAFTFSLSRPLGKGERIAWANYDLHDGTTADFPAQPVQFPLNPPGLVGKQWVSRYGGLTFLYDHFSTSNGGPCDNRNKTLESKLRGLADQQDITLTTDTPAVIDGLPARTYTGNSRLGAVRGAWFGSTSAIYATCAIGPASPEDDRAFQHFLSSVQVPLTAPQPPPSAFMPQQRERRRPDYGTAGSPSDPNPGVVMPVAR